MCRKKRQNKADSPNNEQGQIPTFNEIKAALEKFKTDDPDFNQLIEAIELIVYSMALALQAVYKLNLRTAIILGVIFALLSAAVGYALAIVAMHIFGGAVPAGAIADIVHILASFHA